MRHRIHDKKFNRDANERKALLNGLLRNLAIHGEIITTVAKAKELKRLADKAITTAKVNTVAARRQLHATFGKRDVVNTLVDVIAPALSDRNSGYTTLVKMGPRRGDNTPMAKIAFVNNKATGSLSKLPSKDTAKAEVKAAPAAKTEKAAVVKAETASKAAKPAVKKAAPKKAAKATEVKE